MITIGSRVRHHLSGEIGTISAVYDKEDEFYVIWDNPRTIIHNLVRSFNIYEVTWVARPSQQRRFKNTHIDMYSETWANRCARYAHEHHSFLPFFGEPSYD